MLEDRLLDEEIKHRNLHLTHMCPKMNLLRSQPGGGLGGSMMNSQVKQQQRVPPVMLHLDVNPPILDTSALEQPGPKARPTQSKPQGRGRALWQQLNTFIYKMCAATPPVTWVTPEVLAETPRPPYPCFPPQPPQYLQVTSALNPNAAPFCWYPAPLGGAQLHLMDPLSVPISMWQAEADHVYQEPPGKYTSTKLNKPLNPEAKEWVPQNYHNTSCQTTMYGDEATFGINDKVEKAPLYPEGQVPIIPYSFTDPVIARVSHDFCEITEDEVKAVRKSPSLSSPSVQKAKEPGVQVPSNSKAETNNIELSDPVSSMPKDSHSSEKLILPEAVSDKPCNMTSKVLPEDINQRSEKEMAEHGIRTTGGEEEGLNEERASPCSVDTNVSSCDNIRDVCSFSYASIVGRAAPSLPPSPDNLDDNSQVTSAKYGKVVQPLPKVFVKDKIYPKEKAVHCADNKQKNPVLFKSVSKSQKATSKSFLKELKSSPVKSQNSGNCGVRVSMELSFSPDTPLSSSLTSSPKSDTSSPLGSPAIASYKTLRTFNECGSTSLRVRTGSESSVTSLESVDIEFGEVEADKKVATSDNLREVQKVSANIQTPKYNNFLSCILGGDESESEESEDEGDDSEGEWDKVCREAGPIDDTWETFGFGLCLVDSSPGTCSQLTTTQGSDRCSLESIAYDCFSDEDIETTDDSLDEVNRKWEEEVAKDVSPQSERRVKFGGMRIHPMVTWSYAYKSARRGEWEQYARDRARFSQRIASLESVLSPVLSPDCRDRVYESMQHNAWPS